MGFFIQKILILLGLALISYVVLRNFGLKRKEEENEKKDDWLDF